MQPWLQRISFALLFLFVIGSADGINYLYLSHYEMTEFGDRIRWWADDSEMCGVIRTNSQFAIMGGFEPSCCLTIIQVGDANIDPNPDCPGNVHNNALPIVIPEYATELRERAAYGGMFFNPDPSMRASIRIDGDLLRVWWGISGVPVDTTEPPEIVPINPQQPVIWFDCPLRIKGVVSTTLILGASTTVGLEDNILYASSDPITGALAENHPEKFALVSEGDIKILNTYANGRNNSNGLGPAQPNPDSTSIALNGFFFPLNQSFTFEQQNMADSGYVCIACGCTPVPGGSPNPNCANGTGGDERGTVYLWGGLTQRRRGYVHRSCCGGTGYDKYWRNDPQLENWEIGVLEDVEEPEMVDPDTVFFGDVAVGSTARDTVELNFCENNSLGAVIASIPFDAEWIEPLYGPHFRIPVSFAPAQTGNFSGVLYVTTTHHIFQIPLYGHGVAGDGPGIVSPSIFPNPFNNSTTIAFSVQSAGHVRLELFDVLGRHVATLLNEHREPGTQRVTQNGQTLASGIYLVNISTPDYQRTEKLLLIK